MVVRMRSTRSHTGNRRSHHALKAPALTACPKCKSAKLKHRACGTCGFYKEISAIKVISPSEKIAEKKAKKTTKK